ncbi:MAG: hypothetical protein WA087_04240 [Candidatus Saccharimonadales bacterium]
MKIAKTNRNCTKPLMITSGFIALIIIAILSYVLIFGGNFFGWTIKNTQNIYNTQNIDNNPPTTDQIKDGVNTKNNTQTNTTTNKSSISVTISAINQTSSILQIRAIADTLSDTGSCTLKLTKASAVVTKTASTQTLPSSMTCKGFDIPKTELSKGEWQITLTITAGSLSGVANSTVEID